MIPWESIIRGVLIALFGLAIVAFIGALVSTFGLATTLWTEGKPLWTENYYSTTGGGFSPWDIATYGYGLLTRESSLQPDLWFGGLLYGVPTLIISAFVIRELRGLLFGAR